LLIPSVRVLTDVILGEQATRQLLCRILRVMSNETLPGALDVYFRGERDLGLALAVAGVVLAIGCFWVWRTQAGGFAWGLLVPLILGAASLGAGGTFLAVRSANQRVDFAARLATDPKALVAAEIPRMEKVNQLWPRAKIAWTVVILTALVLLMAVKRDWSSGVGLGLLLLSTCLFFVDVFAERRAEPYTAALLASSRS